MLLTAAQVEIAGAAEERLRLVEGVERGAQVPLPLQDLSDGAVTLRHHPQHARSASELPARSRGREGAGIAEDAEKDRPAPEQLRAQREIGRLDQRRGGIQQREAHGRPFHPAARIRHPDQRLRLRRAIARRARHPAGLGELDPRVRAPTLVLEAPGLSEAGVGGESVRPRRVGCGESAVEVAGRGVVVGQPSERGEPQPRRRVERIPARARGGDAVALDGEHRLEHDGARVRVARLCDESRQRQSEGECVHPMI